MREVRLDRPLAENQRGGDLAVRLACGDEGRDASLSGREPFLTSAAADPPELGGGLLRPRRRPALLEERDSLSDRLAGSALAACAPEHDTEREERPRAIEAIADLVVLRCGSLEEAGRVVDVAARCGHEAATAKRFRQHPAAAQASRGRLPFVDYSDRIVGTAVRQQRLDVVASPEALAWVRPAGRIRRSLGRVEALDGHTRMSAPQLDQA